MNCFEKNFQDFLSNCNDTVKVNALLPGLTEIKWEITDKFDNLYEGEATTDSAGFFEIDVTDLPAGLINSYGGVFVLRIFDINDGCKQLSFRMAKYYEEIWFNTARGTAVKDNLGCDFDCAPGVGGSAIFPFTGLTEMDIPWTNLLNGLYGPSPVIQVYRLSAPDTYELVTVSVTLTGGVYSPLTNINVDFGGVMTGYIVIS